MRINNLIIEVTRKCQLKCPHCLRGDTEQIDIETKYINQLLHNVTEINQLTFTGGEPFLNIEAIVHTKNFIKKHNIG